MKKTVLIPLVFGFIFLIGGAIKSYSTFQNSKTIRCTGTIAHPEDTQPQQTGSTTQLDIIGLLTIVASLGFFTLTYLNNRNSYGKKKPTVTETF
jgi:uncharacterized membrane protein HdeD (DUF308 family)